VHFKKRGEMLTCSGFVYYSTHIDMTLMLMTLQYTHNPALQRN